jgi:hypothetical protein
MHLVSLRKSGVTQTLQLVEVDGQVVEAGPERSGLIPYVNLGVVNWKK